jgi:hypothetical protein
MAQAAPRSSSAPTAPTRTTYAAPDFGANRHQNYPVLLSAQANGSNLSLEGELRSTPNRDFRIEVFGNTECDPSGTGEGRTFLGAPDASTGTAGVVQLSAALSDAGGQPFVTATATDLATNETSEFSPCIATIGPNPGTIQLSQSVYVGYEWEIDGLVTITVVTATAAPLSVEYYTQDGTALKGVDYEETTGEVVFQPGDGPKTVVVPVIGDADVEDTEVFYFLLYPLGASVSDGVGDGLIHDDDGATPTPTWTPSSTPTLSVTATNTPPPTNTPAPTNTNAPTATNTPAGTNTVAPTNTAPPTNTPTATMTASATEV